VRRNEGQARLKDKQRRGPQDSAEQGAQGARLPGRHGAFPPFRPVGQATCSWGFRYNAMADPSRGSR
jgi:hypothetical protein